KDNGSECHDSYFNKPKTFSGGRPIAAFLPLTAIGRSINSGGAASALITASSLATSRASALNAASFQRTISRGLTPNFVRVELSSSVEGGSCKDSTMVGSMPFSANSARVWRLLLQRGL